jgi:NADPH:quinone reductase-like Zn-dependent oxidoreductase
MADITSQTQTQEPIRPIMRAFAIEDFGQTGSFHQLAVPSLEADQLLVRVQASGINPVDWKIAQGGRYKDRMKTRSWPLILGLDAAGVVRRVGKLVSGFRVGDEVYGLFSDFGAVTEYAVISATAAVARKPRRTDFVQAAALPTPALTALDCVDVVRVTSGQTVFINGATGGVGSLATQMAAQRGARVIATARPERATYIRQLGASEVIDFTTGQVIKTIRRLHPDGIDALIDLVSGKDELFQLATALRQGGRLVTTLYTADEAALAKLGVEGHNLGSIFDRATHQRMEILSELVDSGQFTIPIERTVPFDQVEQALTESQSGTVQGKLVLLGSPDGV